MKFTNITRDSVPCWYELVWRRPLGMVLRIHTDLINGTRPITKEAPIVKGFLNDPEFKFTKVNFIFGETLGFNDALPYVGGRDNFLEYSIPTPLVCKNTGNKCDICSGTGHDKVRKGKCMYCDGKSTQSIYDYTGSYAVSASLGILFQLLQFPEVRTSCNVPQLMTINTFTIRGLHGGSIYGEFSKDLISFLLTLPPRQELKEISLVMQEVWTKMEGEMKDLFRSLFRASMGENGHIVMDCPGNACGIGTDPDMSFIDRGQGRSFSCHNTDSMMQQFTLLAGLAKLQTMAREVKRKRV